jgi:hypothetical protein
MPRSIRVRQSTLDKARVSFNLSGASNGEVLKELLPRLPVTFGNNIEPLDHSIVVSLNADHLTTNLDLLREGHGLTSDQVLRIYLQLLETTDEMA